MEKLCIIFGAGETYPPRKTFGKDDLIIAADGGYDAATKLGLEPDAVIGDFDSGDEPKTAAYVVKLNRDKDDTDTLAAVRLGLRRGYKTFVIYGGVGGRIDHTMANFETLRFLNNYDAAGYLVDRDCIATVITDGKFALPKAARGTVSVFAFGGRAEGVTEKNLKFPLTDATLTPDYPLGVSNSTVDGSAPVSISVKHGSLLIFFPRT